MRVGIIALLQESNTFLSGKTTLADFERDLLCEGGEVRRRLGDAHHEVRSSPPGRCLTASSRRTPSTN